MKIKHLSPNFITIQMLIATAFVVGIGWYVSTNNISLLSRAGNVEKQVLLSVYPQKVQSTAGSTLDLTPMIVNKNKKFGFVTLTYAFSPTHLTLVNVNDQAISQELEVIMPVDIADANATGRINLIYGLKSDTSPHGEAVKLSTMTFAVNGEQQSYVELVSDDSSILFLDDEAAEIVSEGSKVDSRVPVEPTEATGSAETEVLKARTSELDVPNTIPSGKPGSESMQELPSNESVRIAPDTAQE